MAKTTCDILVERLIAWGVDTVFGLPGDGINGFFEALRTHQDTIRFVHVRHEEVAAFAACGYSKFTGKLGVCVSTAAPGAVHLLNGLYDAKIDGASVLAITGMTYHDVIGTHYLQDIDTNVIFSDVAYYNQRVMGAAHMDAIADEACRVALSRRGVSHLSIPIDIQVQALDEANRSKKNPPHHTSEAYEQPRPIPPRSQVEKAAEALQGKTKIAMLVGAGARGAGEQVEALAEKLGAVVIKAMLGKDVVPDSSPYTTGTIGNVGTRPSQEAMQMCDALIIVGSSFPYEGFYPKGGKAVGVQIDIDPTRIGLRYPVKVGLVGDAKATLQELISTLPRNEDRSFLETMQGKMRDWWALMEERAGRTEVPMSPQVPAWHFGQLLPENAIICGDSGTVTTWAARYLPIKRGQMFSFSGTMCSMASSIPYAIGAAMAYPDRPVFALVGDGGFTMLLGDFITCVQYNLPIKVMIIKNNVLGLIKWEQMVYLGNPQYGVEFAPMDFVKFAEACGARGVRIDDPRTCRDMVAEALRMDGPVIIEAVVDPNQPPMPAMIKPSQAQHLAEALQRGEPNRERIALTVMDDMIDESTFAASPAGVVGRVLEKVGISGDGHGGADS